MGEDQEDNRKSAICVRHEEIAADVREIKAFVQEIALRLERGDGRFEMLHQKLQACETRLDKIDNIFTKVLIAVLIAVILGLGGMVFSGKFGGEGGRHGGSAEKGIEK